MRLVTIKNPFNPYQDRVIEQINIEKGLTVEKLLKDKTIPGMELKCTVNGETPKPGRELIKSDFVVISPVVAKGGKNIFAMVAMIALAVVAPMVGAWAASGVWGTSMSALSGGALFTACIVSTAVMFLGAYVISRFTSTKADTGSSGTTDPTYSWSGVQTMEGQNNPIQNIYGKVKTAGQTIGKYVSTYDNKEYLNWLICAGNGPLNISDIKINDNPVSYYSGMSVEVRSGTNDQSVISNFNDTFFTKTLGYELNSTARTDTAQGNATQGLIVKIEFSNGLYYANDDGGLDEAWVELEIDYRLSGGTWVNLITPGTRVSGNVSSAIRREFRVDGLGAGTYEVRAWVTNRSHATDDSRASVKCYWTGLTSIVYDDFSYPNRALVAIRALATDQISGSPTISFIAERPTVYVWNPNTSAYEQKPANNPAWACYDYVHQCSYLLNLNTGAYEYEVRGAAKELMLYDQFAAWAAFCDAKNLHINYADATVGRLMDKINQSYAPIGRGYVVWFGTKCGCIWDCVKQPVQMFGMGNIKAGSFKEDFMQTSDRANCIELTYNDAAANYERQTVTVYSDDYDDADAVAKTTSITYDGITSYEQAVRTAKYLLYCNKYLVRTVTFEADVDAISCTIGDVILVSHDVPRWERSGRIYKVDGAKLTLTCEDLTDLTKSYCIMYRTTDDVIHEQSCTVSSSADGYTVITIGGDTGNYTGGGTPEVNDVFSLEVVNVGVKPFAVRSITRAQDYTRKIECIEYNANIYNENYNIPAINYSEEKYLPTNVQQLSASQVAYKDASGFSRCVMYASWVLPAGAQPCKYTVLLSKDGINYYVVKSNISSNSIQLDVEIETNYWIKVISVLGVNLSTGTIAGPISKGIDTIPPDVNELGVEKLASGTRRYYWNFDYPVPNDIAGFRIKHIQGTSLNWEQASEVAEGLITAQPYEAKSLRDGTHTIMIKAVDNYGHESENVAHVLIDLGDTLKENVLEEHDLSANSWSLVTSNGYVDPDTGYLMSGDSNTMWSSDSQSSMWSSDKKTAMWGNTRYNELTINSTINVSCGGQFGVDFGGDNLLSLNYRLNHDNPFWKRESDSFWGLASDNFWKIYRTMWFLFSAKSKVNAGDVLEINGTAPASTTARTVIKKLTPYIDVPDRSEHFENLTVPVDGLELPVKTPNYYTVAVRIDSVSGNTELLQPKIVTRQPCVIKIINASGTSVSAVCDITWQGYEKEVVS